MAGIRTGFRAGKSSTSCSSSAWQAYLYKTIDAYYFVLYVVAHSSSPARWWPIVSGVSELIQFSTFLLAPMFNFGRLTQSYTGVLDTFNASKPMNKFIYELQLWGYAAIAGIVLALSIIIMRNYHSRTFTHVWALRVLMYIAFFLKLITSTSVTVFIAPLVCSPLTGMHSLISESCTIKRWDWIIVGGLSFAIIYPFLTSFSYTALAYDISDQPRATVRWRLCTSVRFRLVILVNMFLIVLARQVLFVLLLPQQPEYLALANLLLMLGLFYTMVTSLPYHSETMNKAYGGLTALLLWMAACALVSVLNSSEGGAVTRQEQETRWIDVVLLLGMPIATITGVWVVGRQLNVAMEHVRWIHDELMARQQAALETSSGEQPASYIPPNSTSTTAASTSSCPVLRIHGSITGPGARKQLGTSAPSGSQVVIPRSLVGSVSHITILIRIMTHQELWSTAMQLAREAASLHPDSAELQYLSAWIQECLHKRMTSSDAGPTQQQTGLHLPQPKRYLKRFLRPTTRSQSVLPGLAFGSFSSSAALSKNNGRRKRVCWVPVQVPQTKSWDCSSMSCCKNPSWSRSAITSSAYPQFNSFGSCSFGVQKDQGLARVSFSAFQDAVRKIIQHTQTAQAFYVELVSQYPNATQILKSYSEFARLVLNDPETAETYAEMAKAARQREEEFVKAEQQRLAQISGVGGSQLQSQTGTGTNQVKEKMGQALGMAGFSRNAVVTVNAQGVIEHVNEGALVLFGYEKKNDLRGRKINTLIPYPYKTYHDYWVDQYRSPAKAPSLAIA
ncbi:hypothetical protein BCR44DRAFT_1176385 [Catenaria anguillulae PL171]|uniref:TmcB/TmcC TPR repeats domain-containing protein n=1 Tax=Catenaria anguillulae PL171 TaxID=765915 RepID=A0A1Y2I137_9FUNG|nr:hypothetical protein BCR44DRAFT_1176385 [Catenaria anguillulae PL171]